MEEYLEEIADSLAGFYIVNESEDGKSLELTPVNKEASPYYKAIFKEGNTFYLVSDNEVFGNNEYSFKTDDLDELINLLVMNHNLDECYSQAGSLAKDGIEIDGIKGTISNSGLHESYEDEDDEDDEDYDEEAEVEEDPYLYGLFLKFAKYHKDELQDTDDLWDMQDRILGMSSEDVLKECPEGFTIQEVREMKDYLEHAFEANAFGKLWDQVHESCNKTESVKNTAIYNNVILNYLSKNSDKVKLDYFEIEDVIKELSKKNSKDLKKLGLPEKDFNDFKEYLDEIPDSELKKLANRARKGNYKSYKTESFNSMAEDYIRKVLDELFEDEEFDVYDREGVVKEVIQFMEQDGILMEKPSEELKQLIRDLFDERLEKDLMGEGKELDKIEDYLYEVVMDLYYEGDYNFEDKEDEEELIDEVINRMKKDNKLKAEPDEKLKQKIKDVIQERIGMESYSESKENLNEAETGVDKAINAIEQYFDNNDKLNVDWLTDNIMLDIRNTKFLYDKLRNKRVKNHSVAYEGLVYTLGNDNDLTFTSKQVQAAFKKLGLDYKEILKPAIKEIDDYRAEMDNEEKLEGVNERFLGAPEEVIDDSKAKGLYSEAKKKTLTDLYNEICSSDLDTEYREAFGRAIKKLKINKKDNLSKEQIQKIMKEIDKEMKDDYQYDKFKVFSNTYLKEDVIAPEEVLELLIPNESDIQPEEVTQGLLQVGDIQNPEAEVTVATVDTNECPECLAEAQSGLSNLAKYLISAEASIKVLHHNLIGGEWFENHEKLGDYAYNIGTFQDDVIEQLIMLGGTEPSVEEAIKTYPTLEVQPRNKQESFAQLKIILDTIVSLIDQAKVGLADDIVSKLEEYQNSIRKEADYKVVRNLQEQYVLVSNKTIKNKLKLESKIEDVKKEAHDEAIRTGYDQYVYQLGEDIFFADNKPTDTRLINRGILTLGRYRVGIENAKPIATWFEESKSTSKNKRVVKEDYSDDPSFRYALLDRLKTDCEYYLNNGNRNPKHLWAGNEKEQIAKMKELWNSFPDGEKPEYISMEDIENYEKQMVNESKTIKEEFDNNQLKNNLIGMTLEAATRYLTNLTGVKFEYSQKSDTTTNGRKAAGIHSEDGKQEVLVMTDTYKPENIIVEVSRISLRDPFDESLKESKDSDKDNEILIKDFNSEHNSTAQDEINNKADYKHNELNVAGTPLGKDVESVATSSAIVGESKEVPDNEKVAGEDYKVLTLDEYKRDFKKDIDNCYGKTYGKDMDKDLYNSLAEFMYSDSITGGINTKTTYKSMNDKIKEAEIFGKKVNILDNAPDGHEENQPK